MHCSAGCGIYGSHNTSTAIDGHHDHKPGDRGEVERDDPKVLFIGELLNRHPHPSQPQTIQFMSCVVQQIFHGSLSIFALTAGELFAE